jgi:hypothetical protein
VRRAVKIVALCLAAALIPAAPAAGHAFYVQVGGTGSGVGCADPSTPCPTITDALNAADDIILVSPGTYSDEPGTVNVTAGKTLIAQGVAAQDNVVIEAPPAAGPTLTVTGTVAHPARAFGFTIKGAEPAVVNGDGRLSNNFLADAAVPDDAPYVSVQGSGTAVVESNVISDPDPLGREIAIKSSSTASPLVVGNQIAGFWRGVDLSAGTPTIRANTITGAHDDATEGAGIRVAGGSPAITENQVSGPGAGAPAAIQVEGPGSATLSRNRLLGHDPALRATGASPVSLTSDLIANGGEGIVADATAINATNLTAFDAGVREISLTNAPLTLNSSVVEHPIAAAGTSSCAISFSAGPTTSGGGCDSFQLLSGDGVFSDSGYGVAGGSPLVDAGDPSPPPAGALDLGGDPRAAVGVCGNAERRDIGADEFVATCAGPPPPDPPPAPPPFRDTDPPASRIDKLKLDGRAALLRFSADEPVAIYSCKLDDSKFKPCSSPKRYRKVDLGRHVFQVKAVDMAGNVEPDSARKRFKVK